MQKEFLLKQFLEMDVKNEYEEEILKCIKENKFSHSEKKEVIFRASELGYIQVLKEVLKKYRFKKKKNDSVNYALCWASFAPNSKEVFCYLIKDKRFNCFFEENAPLMWALQNDASGTIMSKDIAQYMLKNFKISLTSQNIGEIFENILDDYKNSYKDVILPLFYKLRKKEDLQNFFELFVAHGYKEEVEKICKKKHTKKYKKIDFSIPFKYAIEKEDFEMAELLYKCFHPTDEMLKFSIDKINENMLKNFKKIESLEKN